MVLTHIVVDEERATRVSQGLRADLESGAFESARSALEFVPLVNARLEEASGDPHLHLGYSFEAQDPDDDQETPEEYEIRVAGAVRSGFGIARVERLAGNIALLEIRRLHHPSFAGTGVSAAMTLLHETYGLILDLRGSRGGTPEMVSFLLSHFVDHEPVNFASTFLRPRKETLQHWTQAWVPAGRYLDKPVYVLVDSGTYSGSEGLAFHLRRTVGAVLLGERTRGGARIGRYYGLTPTSQCGSQSAAWSVQGT